MKKDVDLIVYFFIAFRTPFLSLSYECPATRRFGWFFDSGWSFAFRTSCRRAVELMSTTLTNHDFPPKVNLAPPGLVGHSKKLIKNFLLKPTNIKEKVI
jgi:hypothetical protein